MLLLYRFKINFDHETCHMNYPSLTLLLVFLTVQSYLLNAQTISTVVGNGTAGYTGDGGPATNATLDQPNFLCHDALGNLLIADYHNNVIRKISKSGVITTIAGNGVGGYSGDGGSATAAKLRGPMGVAVDAAGNIYITDLNNHVVRKVNTVGVISTVAGNGFSGYGGDGGPATNAKLNLPYGLVFDDKGNCYVADALNYSVRKINSAGIITTIAGNGTKGFSGDGGPATNAQFKYLGGLALDNSSGDVYVADYANHRIRKVNKSGVISTFAGTGVIGNNGDGGPASAAALNGPNGVYIDNLGYVYIVDNYANVVRKVTPAGVISTIAGNGTKGYSGDGGPATLAQLSNPNHISINSAGDIFIAEFDNHTVMKITYRPEAEP